MKNCDPLVKEFKLSDEINLKWIDIIRIADPNIQFKKVNVDGKELCVYECDWDKNPPLEEYHKLIQAFRMQIINKWNNNEIVVAGTKNKKEIISEFKKYLKLDVSDSLIEQEDKRIVYNFNRFGNVVCHWFPELFSTPITKSKKRVVSALDLIKDKENFHKNMRSFILQDRMHIWTFNRTKLSTDKKIRHFIMYLREGIYNGSIRDQSQRLFPNIKSGLRLGMGAQVVTQFPTAPSKFIIQDGLKRTVKTENEKIKIFDPCGGWGGRLVGMLSNFGEGSKYENRDITIMTNDVNNETKGRFGCVLNFWNDYIYESKKDNIKFIETVLPAEDISLEFMKEDNRFKEHIGTVNIAITSPPYFNKEAYNKDNPLQSHNRYNQYDTWRDGFLKPLLKNTYDLLKKGGIFYLNIADVDKLPLQQDTIRIAKQLGYQLVDTYYMAFAIAIGNNKNKDDKIVNNNMIFCKGKYRKSEPIYLLRKI